MPNTPEKYLEIFWNLYREKLNEQELHKEDWVTYYKASKNSGLTKYIIRRLASDGLIRTQNKRYAYPDVKIIKKLLEYFEEIKKAEIIKEEGFGNTKRYLLLDYQSQQNKSIIQTRIELFVIAYYEFMNYFFECHVNYPRLKSEACPCTRQPENPDTVPRL